MSQFELKKIPSDIEKIQKFKTLFWIILKNFYDQIDQLIMESILHVYFEKFCFEVELLWEMTKIPEKNIRQTLFKLEKDKIIKPLRLLHIDS